MPFIFKNYEIEGLKLIIPQVYNDERGFFSEMYKKSAFFKNGINIEFKQDNYSLSKKGTLRGLHYQIPPKGQAKLIKCIKGEIFDVTLDLRKNSPDFGKWAGIRLSDTNNYMLYIPVGFAHGFLTLSEEAVVHYKVSEEYSQEHERGILWNDTELNITWNVTNPILSEKDKVFPCFKDVKDGL